MERNHEKLGFSSGKFIPKDFCNLHCMLQMANGKWQMGVIFLCGTVYITSMLNRSIIPYFQCFEAIEKSPCPRSSSHVRYKFWIMLKGYL